MMNTVLDSKNGNFVYRAIGIVVSNHNLYSLMMSKRLIDVALDYIHKLTGKHIFAKLLSHRNNYIVVLVFSDSELALAIFSRMFDIILYVFASDGKRLVIDRRKADDIISSHKIFDLYTIRRAPAGGATIWLLKYKGGQFMPIRAFSKRYNNKK